MAYAVIQFVENGQRKATLVRPADGHPTGPAGVMDPLSIFIEETSPQALREGSPGALYMAQLFAAREQEAGREIRVVGGEGPMGITAAEVQALKGRGYYYEVNFGREGERTMPGVLQRAIGGEAGAE